VLLVTLMKPLVCSEWPTLSPPLNSPCAAWMSFLTARLPACIVSASSCWM